MKPTRETRARGLARMATSLALSLAVVLSFGGSAAADDAKEEALPATPPAPPSVPSYGTTVKADGTPVAVVVSGGAGGKLSIVNLNTGESTAKDFDDGGADAQPWGFATLKDKTVLIGAGKGLYRYNPADDSVEVLSKAGVPGYEQVAGRADFIWDIAVDENDTAYIATQVSPEHGEGGNVLTWSASGGWGVLKGGDPVEAGQQHVRSIAYENGKLYTTVGAGDPKVYQVDAKTGEKKVMPLPKEALQDASLMYRLEVKAGKLYVGYGNDTGTLVLDIASGATKPLPGNVASHIVTRPDEPKKVYYWSKPEGQTAQLTEYDPDSGQAAALFSYGSLLSRMSPNAWATHDAFVSIEMNGGRMTTYNASTGEANLLEGKITPSARAIQSMVAADNGKLFASWYMATNKMLSATPGANVGDTKYNLVDSPVGQGEGLAVNGETLVYGLYSGAKVGARSTADDAAQAGDPQQVGGAQDRPYAITHTTDNIFAVGTVPSDGKLGGALSLYDAKSNKIQKVYNFSELKYASGVPTDRLAEQSPISMAYRDGKLYIGTTVRGGHTARAKDGQGNLQEAQLVEFDVAKGVVTRVINPFENEKQNAITALTFGDDGQLYGTTGSYVFKVNTGSFEVTKNRLAEGGEINRSWLVQRDGKLFGVLQGQLYAIQASDLTGQVIASSEKGAVSALTLSKDGYLYYARGTTIYRNSYLR